MNEAMKMALEALTNPSTIAVQHAIALLQKELDKHEQAEKQTHTDHPMRHWDRTCPACLAEAEKQEPDVTLINEGNTEQKLWVQVYSNTHGQPLYTAPPKREWVNLTDEQIEKIVDQNTSDDGGFDLFCDGHSIANAVIDKLQELNK
jgi:hypothetical protein